MENKQRNNNNNNNSNKNKNSRPKRQHQPSSNQPSRNGERPVQRRRRVTVDRDVEVVVVSNCLGDFFYENPRMSMVIDLQHIDDEEYITVGDLRTILNSNRKILEGFDILITEVLDDRYTLDDVLTFLGLDKKYEEYYSLTGKRKGKMAEVKDIKDFLVKAPALTFEKVMETIEPKLRNKVIETSVTLFKLKEFGDYNKMQTIRKYVNDDIFADAEETEVENDIYI
ncbi:hypothetical protein ACW5UC_25170 [Priestia aryabhattai]|uniref:hypothetical protein n=1 Tax=Priestia megaterium TaxID=1404 RepID=UPI003F94D726